ncbi:hypothetical protein Y695_03574 [Hydrogenophaga sp. T4]|nr:hypothetical protein Y695_03574 [Hydrogenophaga sp. T4]
MIHKSGLASPGKSRARRPICTMRSVLVTVPVFSGQALAGSTTSASQAVSVMNKSCTTRCCKLASPSRAWFKSGSLMAGFSPITYMPQIFCGSLAGALALCRISTTVRPGWSSSSVFQNASNQSCTSGVFTRW